MPDELNIGARFTIVNAVACFIWVELTLVLQIVMFWRLNGSYDVLGAFVRQTLTNSVALYTTQDHLVAQNDVDRYHDEQRVALATNSNERQQWKSDLSSKPCASWKHWQTPTAQSASLSWRVKSTWTRVRCRECFAHWKRRGTCRKIRSAKAICSV